MSDEETRIKEIVARFRDFARKQRTGSAGVQENLG
jgi:hypothetical protein